MSDLAIDFEELYNYWKSDSFNIKMMNLKVEILRHNWNLTIDQFNEHYRAWYLVAREIGEI
jgi:hypothetical protein